jgi:hypothetical protein
MEEEEDNKEHLYSYMQKNFPKNKGSSPKHVLGFKNEISTWNGRRRLLGIANSLRPRRSVSDEEAQGSPPGKRPPVVECAVKYRFW